MALAREESVEQSAAPSMFWRALSLLILAFVALKVFEFPALRNLLAGLAVAYAALLYIRPRMWLVVLPGLIPVLGFGLWSGRFFFDEFDLLILITLAAMLWHFGFSLRQHQGSQTLMGKGSTLAVWLLALSFGLSTAVTLLPLPEINLNSFNTYYSPFNALRVAKGFLWALLLFPYLRREMAEAPEQTVMRLAQGGCVAMCLLGLVALWERGVFAALLIDQSFYSVAANLLDFSDAYRITGLFADMQIGGAAIDGFIVLAFPIAAALLISGRSHLQRTFGAIALGFGGYAALVTFTRGLYLGLAVAALVIGYSVYAHHKNDLRAYVPKPAKFGLPLLGVIVLAVGIFYWGGLTSVLLTMTAFSVALFAAMKLRRMRLLLSTGMLIVMLAAAFGNYDSLSESKWNTNSDEMALMVALLGSAAAVLFGWIAGAAVERTVPSLRALAGLAFLTIVVAGTIPALGGVRVLERFSTVSADSDTRIAHWRRSLAMMDDGLATSTLGQGVGSFPRAYFANNLGDKALVNYFLDPREGKSVLALGYGDFNFMQKIPVTPGRIYKIKIRALANPQPSRFAVKLCEKNILFSDRWVPSCKSVFPLITASKKFQNYEFDLDIGTLGHKGLAYWPPTLQIGGGREDSTIFLDEISIRNDLDQELVRNGSFENGLDGWLFAKDFGHLAWHIKNAYLHVYFEQGLLGAMAYLLALALAIKGLWPSFRGRGTLQSSFILASIAAFMATGLFETMLNVPRVSWLFFTLLMMGLSIPDVPRRAKKKGRETSSDWVPELSTLVVGEVAKEAPEPESQPTPAVEMADKFTVHFELAQFEFVYQLAKTIKASPDAAIGSIIDELRTKFAQDIDLRGALEERLHGAPTPGRMGKAMVGHKLALSTTHKAYIDTLGSETGASASRVVRHLVDIFIEDCSS